MVLNLIAVVVKSEPNWIFRLRPPYYLFAVEFSYMKTVAHVCGAVYLIEVTSALEMALISR